MRDCDCCSSCVQEAAAMQSRPWAEPASAILSFVVRIMIDDDDDEEDDEDDDDGDDDGEDDNDGGGGGGYGGR